MPSEIVTGDHYIPTRTIFLQRTENNLSLGFMLRGGIEHGLGHFVSSIEPRSEADRQGLRAGDEVLAVCGLPIVGATHKEAVNFMSSLWKLELEIRRVGMIPVKTKKGDPITWVPAQCITCSNQPSKKANDVVTLKVTNLGGKRSLGCSIFKGRDDPGIYVQSTKPGGLARKAGLKPGDQILECNGTSFGNIELSDAVVHLKSSHDLNLVVRKSSYDFGESSGYDSSSGASGNGSEKTKTKPKVAFKAEVDSATEDEKKRVEERKLFESQLELERRKLEKEQEMLRKEAEKLEEEKKKFEEEKRKLAKTTSMVSVNSNGGESESSGNEGLAGALLSEIERRKQQATLKEKKPSAQPAARPGARPEPKPFRPLPGGMMKNDQHDLLMEEFRRVHRKMFANSDNQDTSESGGSEKNSISNADISNNNNNNSKTNTSHESKVSKEETENADVTREERSDVTKRERPVVFQSKIAAEKRQQIEQNNNARPNYPPPPPPPQRTTSISPSSSASESPCPPPPPPPPPNGSSDAEEHLSVSPGIPTPDYDSSPRSSPMSLRRTVSNDRPSVRSSTPPSPISTSSINLSSGSSTSSGSQTYLGPKKHESDDLVKNQYLRSPVSKHQWKMTTFSKRHPLIEVGSLESFCIDESESVLGKGVYCKQVKPPAFYFEPRTSTGLFTASSDNEDQVHSEFEFLPRQSRNNRSVRFDEGGAAIIASHDYRVTQATGKSDAKHLQTDLLHTLKKSALKWESTPALGPTSDEPQPARRPIRSVKKNPAPPPPPPPPPPAITMARADSSASSCQDIPQSSKL